MTSISNIGLKFKAKETLLLIIIFDIYYFGQIIPFKKNVLGHFTISLLKGST